MSRELERAFEEVADLEESPERDELTARLIALGLMGFRVDQIGQGAARTTTTAENGHPVYVDVSIDVDPG